MTITKRQKLVDQFNDPNGKEFIFLLSSKAGGCGINLIGANRLILFDPGQWLPSHQSSISLDGFLRRLESCCWSAGVGSCMAWWPKERMQVLIYLSKVVNAYPFLGFVYRFISTGTIEEKIFQRQASKQALSSAVVDEKEDAERHFSVDSLRQLFTFNNKTICDTHDTFKCKRCKDGRQMVKAPALLYGDAST